MTRRLVLAAAALATAGAGVFTAVSASAAPTAYKHQVCLVTSADDNHQTTSDYCISWNGILQ